MKKFIHLLLIPMIISILTAENIACGFSDVESGDEHYVSITYLEKQGIIDGYDDNTFRAFEKINRAEALKMLTIASGVFLEEEMEKIKIEESPFTDTPKMDWYTKYVQAAKDNNLIHGYEDGTFRPEKTINLAETIKIFISSFENLEYPALTEDNLFFDTPIDEWYAIYIAFAKQKGLLNISANNEIFPHREMTRGYVAEIIYRMIKSSENYEFGKATFYGSAVQGHLTASGETFDMNKFTAAHKYLPFGSIVEVTNLANDKSVQVRITDRGPYGYGRVLDLSSGAFSEIAWLGTGIINVQYKIVHLP
ncbi:septal ring lytic transglycosylase RlpA family protein [Candidatus Peregrinibacteria bacterium]|nr:septal ring lytic transglycosylase RlpA family protein [Candidatus Peregrinibacteria bacterium]